MNTNSTKLYALNFNELRTYIFATLFVVGNIVLPQMCHLIPQGGLILLPIYFFTLVASYKYGWRVGLLTAIASPLINNLLFGMPPTASLPIILIKSALLVAAASLIAARTQKVSLMLMVAVVAIYQIIGGVFEFAITSSFASALQDFKLGWPGMLIQVLGGYVIIKNLNTK
ncbi:MAG: ECF transporter S component [Salinivirgaceae bacterium]|nr:ECF transporter S component [Salinivirgaceae bacterium]